MFKVKLGGVEFSLFRYSDNFYDEICCKNSKNVLLVVEQSQCPQLSDQGWIESLALINYTWNV